MYSRHFAAGSTEFAPVGDDKVFSLINARKNEGPGVGYRGLFLPEGLSQTWAAAYLKLCPSETFGHPTNKPPSVGLAASALPRAGAVLVQNWYFSGAAPILAHAQQLRVLPPTRSTSVPSGPHWLHEVKYDGYRPRLERDGRSVRLITRGGYDWTKRFPWYC